mmetsp:Transcript_34681/g.80962  ORF Transcript_34681/g.80962 Transcript_34681/m.80962 type:complete len:334 (+) Transcript_34681:70-1071(+)
MGQKRKLDESSASFSTTGEVYYQGPDVPTSMLSTGKVGTYRDLLGSDGEFFGVNPVATEVSVLDARDKGMTLDKNGFEIFQHQWSHVDYYDNSEVLMKYYPEVEALVRRCTGASKVVAFDHNIRSKSKKTSGEKLVHGNAVQEPLITYGVHNDYTVTSAPLRVRQLAQPPKVNDTLRPRLGATPAIDPEEVDSLLEGRWMLINVWRNISEAPVQKFPLGFCDSQTTSMDDLVTFEIRYKDRTGENYFARHSKQHQWYYFPQATRDEAVLLKVWDSRGKDVVAQMPGKSKESASPDKLVEANFVLHSAFVDPNSPEGAPDRESIEIRTAAFFQH